MTQHFLKPSLITLFTLALVACGGQGTPSETIEAADPVETGVTAPAQIPDGPGDIVAPDFTPPKIISVSPKNNAKGVTTNAKIKILFNEKMNKAKTQAAYKSADLPKNKVTFHWNAAGTQMTIKPKSLLTYGKTYQFKIKKTATDLAGNKLSATKISKFKVIRKVTKIIYSTPAADGWVRSNGTVETSNDDIRIGDSGIHPNKTYRGYVSFNLNALPNSLTSGNILSAQLRVRKNKVIGKPYTDLDLGSQKLIVDHVNYGLGLNFADYNPIVYANLGNISILPNLGAVSKNVLTSFKKDMSNNRPRSQYRLRFRLNTDNDGKADAVHINSGNHNNLNYRPRLTVTYLIP